jgi:hypothetical protein
MGYRFVGPPLRFMYPPVSACTAGIPLAVVEIEAAPSPVVQEIVAPEPDACAAIGPSVPVA